MVAEPRTSKKDAEVAAAVARELAGDENKRHLSVRSLRGRFGRTRLTASAREEIATALSRAGVSVDPDLKHASLDEDVLLRLKESAPSRWPGRLVRGGVRTWKIVVAFLGLLATLAGLSTFVAEWRRSKPVDRLAGDMNIAVAPFTATARGIDADASQTGRLLARQVRTTLGAQLGRPSGPARVSFDIAPPPPLRPVEGEGAAERSAAAERLAKDVGAQLIVYGDVRITPDRTVVTPRFYLSGRALGDADELIGSHRLGAGAAIAGANDSVAARIEARRLLAARTRTLSDFVVGLSYFDRQEYDTATRWFRRAKSTAAGPEASEVIFLFLGHAAGRSGALLRAQRFYEKALDAEPEYARARFGIAEVQYQRSHGGCAPGRIDPDGLHRALRGYVGAEATRQEPYSEVLEARARFGRARALMCLSQADVEQRFADAEQLFRDVVHAYRLGEPLLEDEASEALAGIGLISLPRRGDETPQPELRDAASYYRQALRLSGDVNRQAVFWSLLAFIHRRLGDLTSADRAYRRAEQLDPDLEDRQRYERKRLALKER
jgi:tetratricopeptide (TPR) repeat protein